MVQVSLAMGHELLTRLAPTPDPSPDHRRQADQTLSLLKSNPPGGAASKNSSEAPDKPLKRS